MKRILLMILVVVLGIGLVLVGCGGAPAEEEEEEEEEQVERTTIELSLVTFWPAVDFQAKGDPGRYGGYTDMGHQAYMDTIAARVLAETNDYEIKWTPYYAGTVKAGEIYSAVAAGTYDIGCTGTGYSPGVFPLHYFFDAPGNAPRPNAYIMSLAKADTVAHFPELQNEYTAKGLKLCHVWSVGPGWFLMTPGNKVDELSDFAGKSIRAATKGSVDVITALGGTPVQMSMDEAKQKFEAGLLQGILCPTDTPVGFGLGEYVREATFAPCTYDFIFVKVMNADKYNSLPAKVKAIFDDVNSKWPAYYGQLRTWGELHGLKYCRTLSGWIEEDLPTTNPTEYARWGTIAETVMSTWIGGNATKQALWDYYKARLQYYSTTAPYSTWTPGTAPPTPPA